MTHQAVDNLPPVHPGDLLADELMLLGYSARQFARHIGVAPSTVKALLCCQRGVSFTMAVRLGQAFGTGSRYWINLQNRYNAKIGGRQINISLIPRVNATTIRRLT